MAPAAIEKPFEEGWDVNNSAAVLTDDAEIIYKEWDYLRSRCPVPHIDRHDGYWMLTKFVQIARRPFPNVPRLTTSGMTT
jgi:hypothetical protein